MSDKKLAQPSELLALVGVQSNDGSLANASELLLLVTPLLSEVFETEFEEANRTDIFSSDGASVEFRLSQLFIDPDTLVVRISTDGTVLRTKTDGKVLEATEYVFDSEKSVLYLVDPLAEGTGVLSATFDHGLLPLSADKSILVGPDWLKRAALSVGVQAFNTLPSTLGNRKEKSVANVAATVHSFVSRSVNPHRRARMSLVLPDRTVVNE